MFSFLHMYYVLKYPIANYCKQLQYTRLPRWSTRYSDCATIRGSNPNIGKGYFPSPKRPDPHRAHPASFSVDKQVHSRSLKITTHLHLLPGVSLSGAVPLLTLFFWVIIQRVVVIPYRRFGTTYLSHLQFSRIPEQTSSHLLRGGSLESRIILYRFTQHYPLITCCFSCVYVSADLSISFSISSYFKVYTQKVRGSFHIYAWPNTIKSDISNHLYIIQIIRVILLRIILRSDFIVARQIRFCCTCTAVTLNPRLHIRLAAILQFQPFSGSNI